MKVGLQSSKAEASADFMLIMKSPPTLEEMVSQLKKYLGNSALK
jgi:hypothetical protein